MRNKLFVFFIFTKIIFAQTISQDMQNLMLLDLPKRGQDLLDSYNILKSVFPSSLHRIFFKLKNGQTITDIYSVSLLSQKTILCIQSTKTSKIKYFFVPVENIMIIDYTQ